MGNTQKLFFELEGRTADLQCAKDLLCIFISFLDDECPFGEQENEAWRCQSFVAHANVYKSALCAAFDKIRNVDTAIEEIISKGLTGEIA